MWTDVTMADPNADIDTIEDEDLLKQMWQATEDFADKRRIRARMYKLREKRLKDFYTSDDVMSTSTPPSATETTTTTSTSSRRTSSSFTSSSSMMETDAAEPSTTSTKRRISGMTTTTLEASSNNSEAGKVSSPPEDPVVSEKIRRKSSVRTQRLQKVLNEIERPMSPDSGASAAVVMTTSTSTSSSSRKESRNFVGDEQEQQKPVMASTNGTSQWPVSVKDDDEQQMMVVADSACSYQELKSSSSIREWTEGDILTIVEIRETWRKVLEPGVSTNSAPVTQRVTLTKTIRKRLSDGVLLEENEDEVIDDIEDGENLQPMTAIDAALRRSSLVSLNSVSSQQNISSSTARPASPDGVIEERIAAKRTFSTGLDNNQDNQASAGSDVDSLDGQAPEPSVTTRNITSSTSSTKRSTITSSTPTKTSSTNVTKRSDSGQIRSSPANSSISRPSASRSTTITSSSVTSNNRSTGSANISNKKSALPVSKTTSSSSISRTATPSTPKKKISDASSTTDGADVAEFIRLEAEIKQKTAPVVTTSRVTTKSVTSSATSGLRKPGAGTAPLMTRTVETTRIVRAKDEPEDKPWRQNSKSNNSGSNTPNRVATNKATMANKDKGALHSNVLTVLEKYVETDGCAIHGCCDHHGEQPDEPVAAAPAVEVTNKSSRTTSSSTKSVTSTSQWTSPSKKEPEVEPTTTTKDVKSRLKLSMSPAVNTTVAGAKTAGSPMLDSPSVVKKARSLFHHSDSSEALNPAPSSPKVTTNATSTARPSFEPNTTTTSSTNKGPSSPLPMKREGTKVWESTAIKKPEENTVKARSPSPPKVSATATVDVTTKVIEDIEDLTLLENMLNTATNYDDRSRIRAHIRTVKKQLGLTVGSSPMVTRKTIPSADSPKTAAPSSPLIPKANPIQKPLIPEPTQSTEPAVIRRTTPSADSSPAKPLIPEISQVESTVIRRTSTVTSETVVTSTKEETSSGGSSPRNSVQRSNSAAWRRQPSDGNLLAKSASSSSTHLPEDSSITTNPETLDITSSYGTGPMDEFGKPLFGLGALRRKKAPSSITDSDATPAAPQPIIIERSQTLTELQKLHEQQTIQASKEPESTPMTEKPRLKLRDSFTFGISTDQTESSNSETPGSASPEPIIGERSAALREIIRIHESTVQQASEEEQQIPTSPAPKAKLKDSFILPASEPSTPDEDDENDDDRTIEQRSESFQTIVKRHQEQISSNPAAPVKRPGILKKPKDWSPTPTSSQSSTTTLTQETSSTTTSSSYTRKPSIESSIEIQLNPVQSSSIVVHEIPASGLDNRRNSSSVTIEYNSVQDVKVDGGERRGSQQTRKLSIDVEASPTMHTTSMTLPTSSSSSSNTSSYVSNTNKTSTAGLKLTGDSSGHTIRNTSTFQVTKTTNNKPSEPTNNSGSTTSSSFMLTGLAALRKKPAPAEVIIETPNSTADPTPWRKKSVPSTEEPSSALKENNNEQMMTTKKSTSSMSNGISTTTNKTSSYISSLNSNTTTNNKSGSVGTNRVVSTVNPLEESTTINRTSSVIRKLPQYQVTETKTTTTVTSNRNSGLPATSVRALAQKFITTGEEKSQPQVSKSASYPRAGLIFRSNSFRSQTSPERRTSGSGLNAECGSPGSPLSRSESLRSSPGRTIQQRYTSNSVQETSIPDGSGAGSRRESSSMVTSSVTSTRSFLQDRTPVRGMQDIIGRMSATPTSAVVGHSEEDARSLSLLNKLIGAQILVQSTEAALSGLEQHPDAKIISSSTTSEELSPDGSRLSRTVKNERSGSLVQSGLDEGTGASWTSRRTSSSTSTRTASIQGSDNAVMSQNGASCIVDGVDINSVDDDFKLNEMLDNCNDYEGRRKIRARIKALLGDSKANGGGVTSSPSSSSSSSSSSFPDVIPPASSSAKAQQQNESVMAWVQSNPVASSSSQDVPLPPEAEVTTTLFDSGTESGEDSTTQSNHSQSDLTSFMANLKLHSGSDPPSLPPEAAQHPDFLRTVDSVLDKLKNSLRADESVKIAGTNQQEVLNEFIASGGLDSKQPWSIHPEQQSELIGLIDRLQSSLHYLQNQQGSSSLTKAAVEASNTLVKAPDINLSENDQKTSENILSSVAVKVQEAVETPLAVETKVAVQSPSAIKVPEIISTSSETISTLESSAPVSTATSPSLSAVKMRAKTFSNPRPEGFRSSWRGSTTISEPSTPSTMSPVPPPKVHWKLPDFLKSANSAGTASAHRPIWCSNQENQGGGVSPTPPGGSRIVLEKSGIRGRFVHQPELAPAPKFTPKTAVSVKLPSFLLRPQSSSAKPPSSSSSPTKIIETKMAQQAETAPLNSSSSPTETIETKMVREAEAAPLSPVLKIRAKAYSPVRMTSVSPVRSTPTSPAEERKSRPREVPWKVKLAKKKAERSQSSTPMDGQLSVDLRKSIQQAAHRKSLEDVTAPSDSSVEAVRYPILKQKSLGELYVNSKPKPFLTRSESLGVTKTTIPVESGILRSWSTRSSSLDRQDSAEASTPVITAAIAPSPSGHNWVLSTSSSNSPGKAPLKRQEAMENKQDSVGNKEEDKVVTGILKLPAGTSPKRNESMDPSKDLFTPSESIQIAVHKAAINKQIWAEEARRRSQNSSVSSPPPVDNEPPAFKMPLKPQSSLPDSTLETSPHSSNSIKDRNRRSNTIQLAIPAGIIKPSTSDKVMSSWRPVQAPPPSTSVKNTGFLASFNPIQNNTIHPSSGLGFQPKPLPSKSTFNNLIESKDPTYPCGINKFQPKPLLTRSSFDKSATNSAIKFQPKPLPTRSSSDVVPEDPSVAVTSANLRVQLNSGSYSVSSSAPVKPSAQNHQPSVPPTSIPEAFHAKLTVNNQQTVLKEQQPDPPIQQISMTVNPAIRRLQRSSSSVPSSLFRSIDSDRADADDEASSGSSSSSEDEEEPPPSEVSGIKRLTKMLADNPPAPIIIPKSASQQNIIPSVTLIPPSPLHPPVGGGLRHSASSSAMLYNSNHYVDPSGPTLVGLVAKNVLQQIQHPPEPTYNPTNQLMKSLSGSRLVSQAVQQHQNRPKSLILSVPTPTDSSVRRSSPTIGTKQYEASLSPDSAEKKQREIMQFFMANSSNSGPKGPSPAAPKPLERQASSDVDELFDQLVSSPDAQLLVNQHRPKADFAMSKSRPGGGVGNAPSSLLSKSEMTTTRTTSSNIMRSSGSQPGNNAFSKFQQLDQSVKTTTTRVVRWGNASGGGATSTTPAGLVRTASGIKDFLLQWCQARTRDYQKVQIENFSTSWNDGLAFCALIHRFYPDAFDFDKLESKNRRYNFTLAFQTAEERAGIAPLLDVDDMVAMQRPDWKCVFTYVQSFYRRFKDEC